MSGLSRRALERTLTEMTTTMPDRESILGLLDGLARYQNDPAVLPMLGALRQTLEAWTRLFHALSLHLDTYAAHETEELISDEHVAAYQTRQRELEERRGEQR